MAIRGPFKVVDRLVEEFRIRQILANEVLVDFRSHSGETSAAVFVFPDDASASALPKILDSQEDREGVYRAFRASAYAICVPSVDSDDSVAVYGDLAVMPGSLRSLVSGGVEVDPSLLVPSTLVEGGSTSVWDAILPAPAPVRSSRPKRSGKSNFGSGSGLSKYANYSDKPGPISPALKNRFLEAVDKSGGDIAVAALPASPLEVAVKIDQLEGRGVHARATPRQIEYIAAIAKGLAITPSFNLATATMEQAGRFISKHKFAYSRVSPRRSR